MSKPFLGHCDLDLWPHFQELLCPEHISYIIWCRNPKFGVVIPLGMAEWCIPFWVILTLTLTSGLISSFFLLYYSYLSSNVSYTRPIPLGAFVTCLWHFLFCLILTEAALTCLECPWGGGGGGGGCFYLILGILNYFNLPSVNSWSPICQPLVPHLSTIGVPPANYWCPIYFFFYIFPSQEQGIWSPRPQCGGLGAFALSIIMSRLTETRVCCF